MFTYFPRDVDKTMTNGGLLLGWRYRRWASNKPTFHYRLELTGYVSAMIRSVSLSCRTSSYRPQKKFVIVALELFSSSLVCFWCLPRPFYLRFIIILFPFFYCTSSTQSKGLSNTGTTHMPPLLKCKCKQQYLYCCLSLQGSVVKPERTFTVFWWTQCRSYTDIEVFAITPPNLMTTNTQKLLRGSHQPKLVFCPFLFHTQWMICCFVFFSVAISQLWY